jgi:nicotinamidase-related amidase
MFSERQGKMKKLVVVVDMQKDFIDGALGTKEAVAIVPKVVERVSQFEEDEDVEIVFTRDTHHKDYLETREGKHLPVPHCIEGSDGWRICKELDEISQDRWIFDKPTFGSVELAKYATNNKYSEITLMGLCTDICVISNAMLLKAALPESDVKVIADCCAGVTPESHANALEAMKMCQIEII